MRRIYRTLNRSPPPPSCQQGWAVMVGDQSKEGPPYRHATPFSSCLTHVQYGTKHGDREWKKDSRKQVYGMAWHKNR